MWHVPQVGDLVKEVCRTLKKTDAAAMPDMYLAAMQNAFQRHLDKLSAFQRHMGDDRSCKTMQDFTTLCTRVAQMYHGFNASATALLHIAKVPFSCCTLCNLHEGLPVGAGCVIPCKVPLQMDFPAATLEHRQITMCLQCL